nr:hypothetical protein BaRGS_019183 [Batillaria attramentaria]
MAEVKHKLRKYAAYLQANPQGNKVLQVLRKLSALPVSISLLQETGVGKLVNGFRKHEGDVGVCAKDLVHRWKQLVAEEAQQQEQADDDHDSEEVASDQDNGSDCHSDEGSRRNTGSENEGEDGQEESEKEESGDEGSVKDEESQHSEEDRGSRSASGSENEACEHEEGNSGDGSDGEGGERSGGESDSGDARSIRLSEDEILSTLPETSANYRPWRFQPVDGDRHKDTEVDAMQIVSKNTSRTQVYSGRRHGLSEVKSLFDLSIQVLIDNIDALEYVGGIPFDILKPVLERATVHQLYNLEDQNPQFLEDTDYLWKIHCQKDFRGCEPDELESWRELYLRKHDEREAKYQKLKASMTTVMKRGQAGRQVKMAFVDSAVKPPREVRRQQMKYGTAGMVRGKPGPTTHSTLQPERHNPRRPTTFVPLGRSTEEDSRQPRPFIRPAPLMEKTLKMMKKVRR